MAELNIEQIAMAHSLGEVHYLVRLLKTDGSTPRDAGALMLVGMDNVFGTIGGGSAEWVAIKSLRKILKGSEFRERETITLGPEIDQCCGGVIEVSYELLTDALCDELQQTMKNEEQPNVLVFGAGHTGVALANSLSPLMPNVEIIDSREGYAGQVGQHEFRNLALPEDAVRAAIKDSIFIIATHDHSLDFLITAEALSRKDAAYVGMIGSPTKRAVLKSWMAENDYDDILVENLHCPIGGTSVHNKRPEVIAAMTAVEILQTLEGYLAT